MKLGCSIDNKILQWDHNISSKHYNLAFTMLWLDIIFKIVFGNGRINTKTVPKCFDVSLSLQNVWWVKWPADLVQSSHFNCRIRNVDVYNITPGMHDAFIKLSHHHLQEFQSFNYLCHYQKGLKNASWMATIFAQTSCIPGLSFGDSMEQIRAISTNGMI